jgi:cell fate regulator YaaT (PSP1 superfamily)
MFDAYLVRYGSVPEVARCACSSDLRVERGDRVVVRTHRGLQLGTILEADRRGSIAQESDFAVVRLASEDDEAAARRLQERCEAEFYDWCRRILLWKLPLELIDLERTLDAEKLILYVLTERGPAATSLALHAAAEGLGLVEVQPVTATGGLATSPSGGCGTGHCGCH